MTRAWFRRRLDDDPRRWVLLLAALAGPSAFALNATGHADLVERGPARGILLLMGAFMPVAGVLGMLAHGRLLWWTGRILGGRARPAEIHAAFAWSELPFVVAAAPLVVSIPLRLAAQALDPRSAVLQFALDLLHAASGALVVAAALAAVAGGVVHVRFLGEAQGFGAGRACANHVLALFAGLALFAIGVAATMQLPGVTGLARPLLGCILTAGLAGCVEAALRIFVRRQARRTAAPGVQDA
jgi:hypothetical protein